jgi:hypothetical protein
LYQRSKLQTAFDEVDERRCVCPEPVNEHLRGLSQVSQTVIPFPPDLIYIFLGVNSLPKLGAQTLELEKTVGPIQRGDRRSGFSYDPLGKAEPLA